MLYRVIGVTSGKALEGLDIAFVEFHETGGKWTFTTKASECYPYAEEWLKKIRSASGLSAYDYQVLHSEYAQLVSKIVLEFIEKNQIQYQVMLISFHGHTIFHDPQKKISSQLGHGAILAALTGINVVTDLRATDIALGGRGNPIAPMGEKLLFGEYTFFLNLGALATLALKTSDKYILSDVCPCSKLLNLLAEREGKRFDAGGNMAAGGNTDKAALTMLNDLEYYRLPWPKSLAHDFASDVLFPLIKKAGKNCSDALRTSVEHIVVKVSEAVNKLIADYQLPADGSLKMMITGGSVNNTFLLHKLEEVLKQTGITPVVPEPSTVEYKESIITAVLGILRWREENNTLSSVTGATRDSIGGAVWMGLEA
jgi:anhydro-N-acetylmuramic acid kinase